MLTAIGVADYLAETGCPIRRIAVADGLQPGGLHFDPDDDEPLGFMHENRHLRAALHQRAEAGKNVWLLWKSRVASVNRDESGVAIALEDGRRLSAPLLIAADGRNSRTREAAGINVARWKYDHQAIVSVLRHERAHEHVAYEIFYPSGPFALLPMNDDGVGHRSAVVWSVPNGNSSGWLSLNDEDFAGEAECAMGGFLGKIEMLAPRSSFPLGFHHAAQITASAWHWSAILRTQFIQSPGRGSTSVSATPLRLPRFSSKGRASGSISATGSCSNDTSAGVRSTRCRLLSRRTR